MLQQTSMTDFEKLAAQKNRVVVLREIYADLLTPVRVFQSLAGGDNEAVLLDSSDVATSQDACVYIGLDPVAEFTAVGDDITVKQGGRVFSRHADMLTALREFYQQFKAASRSGLAKFAGGMIGYLSYDAVRYFENIPDQHQPEKDLPDVCFKFYGTNIVFDKRSGQALVTKVVTVSDNLNKDYQQAMQSIDELILKIIQSQTESSIMPKQKETSGNGKITMDLDDNAYAKVVTRAQEFIKQGDAFQVVPSRCFRRTYYGRDFDIYRALRVLNPSPYQFFIRYAHFSLIGSSPEKLVSLQQGMIETMPIAGTRKRGETRKEDENLAEELLNDEKETSEHIMLVDLGRNDVGVVSAPGSVKVSEFQKIHKYSKVMHIVSRVQGQITKDYDAFDVMRTVFPAGTLSGAPKIRAMEIIDEIESSRRGVYGGAIVAIDNQGQMDSCITIRTVFLKNNEACVRAGAGVVIDSDPAKEAQETRDKAQAVLDALQLAERGLV